MSLSLQDHQWMVRAIKLAEQGRYTTSPNPKVGCVLVKNNQVIGEGFHIQAGSGHAEVNALADAKAKGNPTDGATAYVTLEPCSHYGRTPPCAVALVKAQVTRVVVGMVDPNPKVAGNGIQILKQAGIDVHYPCLEQDCKALNPGFIKVMEQKKPFVQLKLACSLDGKTAMSSGESQWITGAHARADVQHYRAQACAIITGAGTANIDQPKLNVRQEQLNYDYPLDEIRQPVRVVIDNRHSISPDNRLFSIASPILLVSNKQRTDIEWPEHVEQVVIESERTEHVDLEYLLIELAKRGLNRIWVEAGAKLAGAFIQADLADELIIYQAPKLMGENTFGLVNMPNITELKQAKQWQYQDICQVGEDLKLVLTKREN